MLNVNSSEFKDIELKVDDISFLLPDQRSNENFESSSLLIKNSDIFGSLLVGNFEDADESMFKIIMLFEDGTPKSERIEVINSILVRYEIIDNYDIIPAVYLKCDPNELLANKDVLEEHGYNKDNYLDGNWWQRLPPQ